MTIAEHERDGGDTIELPLLDLPVVWSYRRIQGLALHSLAYRCSYRCSRCTRQREATLVAVDETQALVCPACFPTEVIEKTRQESQGGEHDRSFCATADHRGRHQRRPRRARRGQGPPAG